MGTILSLIMRFLPVIAITGVAVLFIIMALRNGASVKLRIDKSIRFLTVIFIMMHLCYFLMLGGILPIFADRFVSKPRMVLLLFILSIILLLGLLLKNKHRSSYLVAEAILMSFLVVEGLWRQMDNGKGFIDSLVLVRIYLYFFLAIPVYKVFDKGRWNFDKFVKLIVILTVIDYGVRAIITIVDHTTGVLIFPNIAQDRLAGYRNGFLRLNPPQTDIIAFIGSFYLIVSCKRNKDKRMAWFFLILSFANTLLVWQARSGIIFKAAMLIVLYVIQRGTEGKKLGRIVVVVIVLALLLNTSYVGGLLDSLSLETEAGSNNTWYRVNAIKYFMNQYREHPIFGIGLIETSEMYAEGGGNLGDIGMLYGLIQLGIPMVIFYVMMFLRGFWIAKRIKSINPNGSIFVFGTTLLLLLTGINIEFFSAYAVEMPLYIACAEYLYASAMMTKKEV